MTCVLQVTCMRTRLPFCVHTCNMVARISESVFDENVAGVPEFWLTIFKNVDMLTDMMQDHDEPILKHLQDIKVKFQESNPMV